MCFFSALLQNRPDILSSLQVVAHLHDEAMYLAVLGNHPTKRRLVVKREL